MQHFEPEILLNIAPLHQITPRVKVVDLVKHVAVSRNWSFILWFILRLTIA
jgi:hypothetical protein